MHQVSIFSKDAYEQARMHAVRMQADGGDAGTYLRMPYTWHSIRCIQVFRYSIRLMHKYARKLLHAFSQEHLQQWKLLFFFAILLREIENKRTS